jgi:superfamily II DNA/RNA helicase
VYDPVTERLIRSVPELKGLDRNGLPRFLTKVYATIASARLTLQRIAPGQDSTQLTDDLDKLRRLAGAFETIACLKDPADPERPACAFVAATSHELLYQASLISRSTHTERPPSPTFVRTHEVSSDVCALLLFQLAGAFPDAMAVAQRIELPSQGTTEANLIRSIRLLGLGHLDALSTLPASPALDENAAPEQVLSVALFQTIEEAMRQLARSLLGQRTAIDYKAALDEARALSSSPIRTPASNLLDSVSPSVLHVLGGPHHLATLLRGCCDTFDRHGTVNLPTPSGLDPASWRSLVVSLAPQRPFLWSNHLDAVSKGLLTHGTSAAISFPTGAGKSTLIQLKIGANLLESRKTVFLVPTHALVDQTAGDLRRAFPTRTIGIGNLPSLGSSGPGLAPADEMIVTTPESCLAILGADRDAFRHVGLVVFDECHLLHPEQGLDDRRSLDSMFCLLNLLDAAPESDVVLLSAMMANPKDLASWLSEGHGRRCLALSLEWKPTRQARGCLVYDLARVRELDAVIRQAQSTSQTKGPPTALVQQLTAVPFGLFCLRHSWTTDEEDYKFAPLLPQPVRLSASRNAFNGSWQLVANRNDVSAMVAASLASSGLRTMVLVQNVGHVAKVTREVAKQLAHDQPPIELLPHEERLLAAAIEEMGGVQHVLQVEGGQVAQHHGLLLPTERRLAESVFQRKGGARVLVASPTLAMGVNLPAEAVVIAGDDRFDAPSQRMKQLQAHELLNAAGRAGRAGTCPQGLVVIVPGKVVGVDWSAATVGPRWMDLQAEFSKSDQCLPISDPIELWLDRLQAGALDSTDISRTRYFLARLPASSDNNDGAKAMLDRTLAAFVARKKDRKAAYEGLVQGALRQRDVFLGSSPQWLRNLCAVTGVDVEILGRLHESLAALDSRSNDPIAWLEWWMSWLSGNSAAARSLHRADERDDGLGTLFENQAGIERLAMVTRSWMDGASLRVLELLLGTPESKLGSCDEARRFVLRLVPDLAFGARVLASVYAKGADEDEIPPAGLEHLGSCIAQGLSSLEELALHFRRGPKSSRRATKSAFREIEALIPRGSTNEGFAATSARVARALKTVGRVLEDEAH